MQNPGSSRFRGFYVSSGWWCVKEGRSTTCWPGEGRAGRTQSPPSEGSSSDICGNMIKMIVANARMAMKGGVPRMTSM